MVRLRAPCVVLVSTLMIPQRRISPALVHPGVQVVEEAVAAEVVVQSATRIAVSSEAAAHRRSSRARNHSDSPQDPRRIGQQECMPLLPRL